MSKQKIEFQSKVFTITEHILELPSGKPGQPFTVSSNLDFIQFDSSFEYKPEFSFRASPKFSGTFDSSIKFTSQSNSFSIQIHFIVEPPDPQDTLEVQIVLREPTNVSIPIKNSQDTSINFSVVYSDPFLTGKSQIILPPNSVYNFSVQILSQTFINKESNVYFKSLNNEYRYLLKITTVDSLPITLSLLSVPFGESTFTNVSIENVLDKDVLLRIENDNPAAFQLKIFQNIFLKSGEKKSVQIFYVPSKVGEKDIGLISFISKDLKYLFKVSGIGTPPKEQLATIVSTIPFVPKPSMVIFKNPFLCPTKFLINLSSSDSSFQLILNKTVFYLKEIGEELIVPFQFSPKNLGRFEGHIIVSTQNFLWKFPIVGNCISDDVNQIQKIVSKSHEFSVQNLTFALNGQGESLNPEHYSCSVEPSLPHQTALLLKPISIVDKSFYFDLSIEITFAPQRPFEFETQLVIKSFGGKKWNFPLFFESGIGKPSGKFVMNCALNKSETIQIPSPTGFTSPTKFKAYFIDSSSEFSVFPTIETLTPDMKLWPVNVTFALKSYGKLHKATLVIDTIDSQFLYELVGKDPEYSPPSNVKSNFSGSLTKRTTLK